MSSKDEIATAKVVAADLQCEGSTNAEIASALNEMYEGTYYALDGHVYRVKDLDCYPATRII